MSTPFGFLRSSRALYSVVASSSKSKIPTSSTSKKPNTTASTAADSKEKKRSTSYILKGTPVSPTLRSFVGIPEISRAEAIKKIWEYIKVHNLQDLNLLLRGKKWGLAGPSNKREIFCDAKLFDGKDKVGFLEIAKLLSPHFVKTML